MPADRCLARRLAERSSHGTIEQEDGGPRRRSPRASFKADDAKGTPELPGASTPATGGDQDATPPSHNPPLPADLSSEDPVAEPLSAEPVTA